MLRRSITGTVLISAAAVALTGCSSGSHSAKAIGARPEVAWARHVCDTVGGTVSRVQLPTIDPKNSAKSKQNIVTFLNGLSAQLTVVQKALVTAGDPPVTNGKQTLNVALMNLSRAQSAVTTTALNLNKAKVTDSTSLKAAITQAGEAMTKFQAYQGPTKDLRANPALNTAFNQAPTCQIHNL